jgi:hypothetical protein
MVDISAIPEATLLVMSPHGIPLYSARGLTQTLTPCADAKPSPLRTINGELRFLGGSQMKKYESVITCTDVEAPPFSGLWPGDIVLVNCAVELSYHTDTESPERTVVRSRVVGAQTLYFPQIEFMVVDYNDSYQEYPHLHGWQLTLSER